MRWWAAKLFLLAAISQATAPEMAAITLAWDYNTEPDVAGYRVYSYASPLTHLNLSMAFTNMVDVGNTNRYRTMVPCNRYDYFAVTAYNEAGAESDYSRMIFVGNIK